MTHTWGLTASGLDRAEGLVESGIEVLTVSVSGDTGYDMGPVRELLEYRNSVNRQG